MKTLAQAPQLVQLVQGSQAWLCYRLTQRNASETAAVLGISPWQTPYQLWLTKTQRSNAAVNAAMQHGSALEPQAREAYEARTGHVMQPLVLQAAPYSASLDGMTLDSSLILEVKCPFQGQQSELWQQASHGEIPPHYQCQIQHQLMVSGAAMAHLWVYANGQGVLVEVLPDAGYMERICIAWDGFQHHLDNDTPPPLTDADTLLRDDAEWRSAAMAYSTAKRAADEAAATLEQARLAILALAHHPREQGAGISVTRYWKAGNVDYKRVPALQGVDLENYRGKAREEVRISIVSARDISANDGTFDGTYSEISKSLTFLKG